MSFGFRIVDIYDDLTRSACGVQEVPNPVPPALDSFVEMRRANNMHDTGLQYANLDAVYTYLRRGMGLRLPDHWKEHFPRDPKDL